MLDTVASYHCVQFQGKLRKLDKMAANLVSGRILGHLAQICAAIFFFKNLSPSVTRYHSQLSSSVISEKTYDPTSRKLSGGRTDGRTDGRE